MISLLSGTVRSISIDRLVIEVSEIGLTVIVTPATIAQSTLGSKIQLFTALIVREDSLTLYGFLNEDSRGLFDLVQTVSGIGPKVAMSIVGAMSPEELSCAISQEQISVIEAIPGIGRKGAQRLILELKGKMSDFTHTTLYQGHQPLWREQLTSALISLGFSAKESDFAISEVISSLASDGIDAQSLELSELLKLSLVNGKSSRG